jgi:CRISPR-associated protein Cmr4
LLVKEDEKMPQTISKLITLQAITFLHPGTGQTTGVVDQPIQREVHTGFPMYASSGFKGSLRDKAEHLWKDEPEKAKIVFGSQVETENPWAGSLSVTDARILAFPVRSLQHVFLWVTCPLVLKRLKRDAGLIGLACPDLDKDVTPGEAMAVVSQDSGLTGPLVLEQIQFTIEPSKNCSEASDFILGKLNSDSGFDPKRLVIIPDQDFEYLTNHGTQISTRIKLNEQKTTTGGGGNMWVEETLPPETIMYALAICHAPRMQAKEKREGEGGGPEEVKLLLKELVKDGYLQIGGNETVGQGWCCIHITGGS